MVNSMTFTASEIAISAFQTLLAAWAGELAKKFTLVVRRRRTSQFLQLNAGLH